jgi:cyclopropane-fatty-acyl-phospholipid synthase
MRSNAALIEPDRDAGGIASGDPLAGLPAGVISRYRREGVLGLGEAFVSGEWDMPDLTGFLYQIFTAPPLLSRFNPRILAHLARELLLNPQRGKGAFEVARRHYDLGNDLFTVMLDRSMTYTCGYWPNASDLHSAQEAKLRLVCEKMQLAPGMKVLDIGCGWGNFAEYAASRYGVSVTGLTVSEEQAQLARERCKGLPVEILLCDYADFHGSFDRVVSIEMIEAVGRKNIGHFFEVVRRCLADNGLFLLQAISSDTFSKHSRSTLDQYIVWIVKYIFPNGYLPRMNELAEPARGRFVMEDLHNFSADYEKTLAAWLANFETGWSELAARYGDEFRRIWRFYLCGCAALFRARQVQLYQIVYAKNGVPGGYRPVR